MRVTTGPLVDLQVQCDDAVPSPSHTRAEVNGPAEPRSRSKPRIGFRWRRFGSWSTGRSFSASGWVPWGPISASASRYPKVETCGSSLKRAGHEREGRPEGSRTHALRLATFLLDSRTPSGWGWWLARYGQFQRLEDSPREDVTGAGLGTVRRRSRRGFRSAPCRCMPYARAPSDAE